MAKAGTSRRVVALIDPHGLPEVSQALFVRSSGRSEVLTKSVVILTMPLVSAWKSEAFCATRSGTLSVPTRSRVALSLMVIFDRRRRSCQLSFPLPAF